jgi:HTH-type transcriptional regulator/antitoxin HipB
MGHLIQIPSQLSSHLRALRKARGLSQAALASRLGLSQARVARIEGDPLAISVDQLLRVLAALGVQVSLEPLPTIPATADHSPAAPTTGATRAQVGDW